MVRALDLRLERSRVRISAVPFSSNNLGQVIHTHTHVCLCHQAVEFGTGQWAEMPCGWAGNRRFGVALAMRHRLQWFIHLRASHGPRKGDEHPAYTPHGVWHSITFLVVTGSPKSTNAINCFDVRRCCSPTSYSRNFLAFSLISSHFRFTK